MANYHVTYDRNNLVWKVKKAGGKRASARTATQKEAEVLANHFCSDSGGGEVRIHRKDNNEIRDSDTVFPGNDLNPPKDTKH